MISAELNEKSKKEVYFDEIDGVCNETKTPREIKKLMTPSNAVSTRIVLPIPPNSHLV